MLHRCHDKTLQHLKMLVRVLSKAPDGNTIPSSDWKLIDESMDFMSLQVKRHEEDEETSIFPMLESKHKSLIDRLKSEHQSQHHTLAQLKSSLRTVFQKRGRIQHALDLAGRLLHMYTHHIAHENKHLLPLVSDFSEETERQVKKEMRLRRSA